MEFPFEYEVIRTRRKTMALEVHRDGRVIVRAPLRISNIRITRFLFQKEKWVMNMLERIEEKRTESLSLPQLSEEQRYEYRKRAKVVFDSRCRYFASIMDVEFRRITIREQKTRWGSCSSERNLNFNWKLMLAPPEILDYIVVHELCHIKEMNHSRAFWNEVESVLPDYRERVKWLKENGWKLMSI